MKSLRTLHVLFVNPSFLRDIGQRSGRDAVGNLVTWLLAAVVVCAIAHTVHFLDADSGFPAYAAQALKGARLVDGNLAPGRPTPFLPPAAYVRAALGTLLVGMPEQLESVPDSLVVVDTGSASSYAGTTTVLLAKSEIRILAPGFTIPSVPYARLFGPKATIALDPPSLGRALGRQWPSLAFLYLTWDLFVMLSKVLAGLPLLFLAAFILDLGGNAGPIAALKKAAYAFTIVLAGTMLEAIAGTNLPEPWYIFMGIALVVVLRSARRPVRAGDPAREDQ